MKNIAVILAGGIGSRLNAGLPKQFIKIAGKMVIEHAIQSFQDHKLIDEIAIVCHPLFIYKVEEIAAKNEFIKVRKILNGGNERYQSSLSAIKAYKEEYDDCNLIFHDAVRPLVNHETITRTINALKKYQAVDVAILATDTIIEAKQNLIHNIPNRTNLRRGQTPQGFRLSTIEKAYKIALSDKKFTTTDDCGVVVKYLPETPVFIVKGDESNMKLTYKEDLYLLEKLFQLRTIHHSQESLSQDETAKLKGKVIIIFGSSYGIGKEIENLAQEIGMKPYGFSRTKTNTDISNHENVKKALEKVYSIENRIDFVVNSAANLSKSPLSNLSYEQINNSIQVNYNGMVNIAKESYKYLKENQGHLLFFTSSSYTRGRMNYAIYSSTKCAVVNFMQALSEEWSSFDIKVNCINPERTKTPMRIKNFGDEPDETLLKAREVAVVTLSTLAINLSGQVIDVKIKH